MFNDRLAKWYDSEEKNCAGLGVNEGSQGTTYKILTHTVLADSLIIQLMETHVVGTDQASQGRTVKPKQFYQMHL
jgi:hypothetical protein